MRQKINLCPTRRGRLVKRRDLNILSLIPSDNWRQSYLPHPREKGKEREYYWCQEKLIFIKCSQDRGLGLWTRRGLNTFRLQLRFTEGFTNLVGLLGIWFVICLRQCPVAVIEARNIPLSKICILSGSTAGVGGTIRHSVKLLLLLRQ